MRRYIRRALFLLQYVILIPWFMLVGPPRVLKYSARLNAAILKAFGAKIGKNNVRIFSPIILHAAESGYAHLTISDGCILNGNNFLDLYSRITLEKGVSLGPGVTIMTHNGFNYNTFLEDRLAHNCGLKEVLIKEGAGIKAGALVVMGVTIGKNVVVAGSAVVNRDVPPNSFVAGVPARVLKEIR